MLPRGRPPGPGTAEEKAAMRREKVRLNVKAYRERKKNALAASSKSPASSCGPPSSPADSIASGVSFSTQATSVDRHDTEDEHSEGAVIPKKSLATRLRPTGSNNIQPRSPTATAITLAPKNGPVYSTALLSAFRNAFLPSTVYPPSRNLDGPQLITPCSPWITSAYDMAMRQDAGALKSGLLAVGLRLNGQMNKNNGLDVASYQMHKHALTQLRNDLVPISVQRHRESAVNSIVPPYLSCLAITMFEMIQSGFSPTILQHVKALNSLIELMYANPNVDHIMADFFMEDFGMLEMMFCLKYGLSSILKQIRHRIKADRLRATSRTARTCNASVYGDILDIVEDLPALRLVAKSCQSRASHISWNELLKTVQKASRIQVDLDAWQTQFECRHGSIMMTDDQPDTISDVNKVKQRLRSYEHGAVGLFGLTLQLIALDVTTEATTMLVQQHDLQVLPNLSSCGQVDPSQYGITQDDGTTTCAKRQDTSKQELSFRSNDKSFWREQIKEQRATTRLILKRLLEVMHQYIQTVTNVTGQSLMIVPCETVRMILDKEYFRLEEETQRLQSEDRKGNMTSKRQMEEMHQCRDIFDAIQLYQKQQFASP